MSSVLEMFSGSCVDALWGSRALRTRGKVLLLAHAIHYDDYSFNINIFTFTPDL
jgi:hypothetical protein